MLYGCRFRPGQPEPIMAGGSMRGYGKGADGEVIRVHGPTPNPARQIIHITLKRQECQSPVPHCADHGATEADQLAGMIASAHGTVQQFEDFSPAANRELGRAHRVPSRDGSAVAGSDDVISV